MDGVSAIGPSSLPAIAAMLHEPFYSSGAVNCWESCASRFPKPAFEITLWVLVANQSEDV